MFHVLHPPAGGLTQWNICGKLTASRASVGLQRAGHTRLGEARTIHVRGLTMAPLPGNLTDRLFVDYIVAQHQHTQVVRYSSPNTYQDAYDAFLSIAVALDDQLYASTLVGARVAVVGSNISLPVSVTGATTWGTGAAGDKATAQFYDFIGRGGDGRRVRATFFGAVTVDFEGLFRLQADDAVAFADALTAVDEAEGAYLTVSGGEAVWKAYINCGVNAYWRNQIR